MLEAYVGTRLGSKTLLAVAASLKIMLLSLPEKAKRVHIHDGNDKGKENGDLRWGFLVDIASGVRPRIR